MKKIIFNTKFLSLVCLIMMAIGVTTSCKKDKVASTKVELLSFGPTGAMHGDTLRFIGNNLDKVTEIDLTGAIIPATGFLSKSPETILIIVPQAAEQGFITLKTQDGDIVSLTKLNLLVPVTVTAMTIQARPGENITIAGTYLNWVKSITFEKDIAETSFVSKKFAELVVKVPINARTGTVTLSTGGTKPLIIEIVSGLKVTLPSVTSFSPVPIVRGDNLTITGTDLNLTMGILFKGLSKPVTDFVSKSATQIVVKVPDTANKGKITLVAYSLLTVESTQSVLFVGDLPDLAPLAYAFYIDGLQNNWADWGWGHTATFNSTDNVRDGIASIKNVYTGQWSALKFANASVATAGYTELAFSIFGTVGTGGKKINVTPSGGTTYTITIDEGKWVEYKLTKAQIGNPATITDLTFQNQDWTGTIYMDQIGFR